jgi:adenylate kinase family enzyme
VARLVGGAGRAAVPATGWSSASARRVTFVGSIGAGKTTLAKAVGQTLGREVVHLDDLWWEPGSYQRTPEAVKSRTMEAERWLALNRELADGETWIIDGSLHLLAVRLARADTVIFVDLPRRICMPRVVKRWCLPLTGRTRPRGSARWLLVLLRWVWKYPQKRIWILQKLADHAPTATIVHLRSRREVRAFLQQVSSGGG